MKSLTTRTIVQSEGVFEELQIKAVSQRVVVVILIRRHQPLSQWTNHHQRLL